MRRHPYSRMGNHWLKTHTLGSRYTRRFERATHDRIFSFEIPRAIEDYLLVLDDFIEREIKPLEAQDDNIRFFDHRREHARTDWDREGLPRRLSITMGDAQASRRCRALPLRLARGVWRQNGSNLAMARIQEYLASKGLGLRNDLQNETSIVGNLMTR